MYEFGVTEIAVNTMPVAQPTALSLTDGDGWKAAFSGNKNTTSGVTVSQKSMMGYPPFWRGVNIIANGVCLPLNVFRRDAKNGREVDDDHPAETIVGLDASPVMDACILRETMQSHALVFGNGMAYIERDRKERPTELWLLKPADMIIRYMDGELWYATTIGGENVKFPGRNVLHIKGLSHNGVEGYSALDIFSEALGLGMAAQQFGSRFFGQGANMGGLLMVPGHFDEGKIRNTLNAWSKMSEGMKNSHKVALLQDGTKFIPTQVTPEQGQFTETREYETRQTVASILGLPPHLLGDSTRTSHNSLEAESESLLMHTWGPWLRRWERECGRKLLTESERKKKTHFIEFNREAIVQMLFKDKIDSIYRQVEMGLLTINEGRQKLNEANVGPDGDKRFHPANWVAIGEEPEQPEVVTTSTEDTEDMEGDTEKTTAVSGVLRAMLETSVTDSLSFERRRVIAAASKQKNFCGWLDGFYSEWCDMSLTGWHCEDVKAHKAKHAAESKRQLLDVAGSSTPETLPANVSELMSTWDDRAITLTANLMESI